MGTKSQIENLQEQVDDLKKNHGSLESKTKENKRLTEKLQDQLERLEQDRTDLEGAFKLALNVVDGKLTKHIRESTKKNSVYGLTSPPVATPDDKPASPTPAPPKEKLIVLGPLKFSRALLPYIGWGSLIAMVILASIYGLSRFDAI